MAPSMWNEMGYLFSSNSVPYLVCYVSLPTFLKCCIKPACLHIAAHWAHNSKLAAVGPQSFLQPMTFTMLCRLSNSRNTHEVRLFITHDDNGMRKTDMCIKLTWIITLINYKTVSIINSWNVMEQQEIWIHWIHWTLKLTMQKTLNKIGWILTCHINLTKNTRLKLSFKL